MQSWWRVLRGVWPYRFSVVLSLICALGVGLSYATGVGVMLPVMKIFVSTEGVHGWASRTVAENRFDVSLADLNETVTKVKRSEAAGDFLLIVKSSGKSAPAGLQVGATERKPIQSITKMGIDPATGKPKLEAVQDWEDKVWMMAHAEDGKPLTFAVMSPEGKINTVEATPRNISLADRSFLAAVDILPRHKPFTALVWVVAFFIFLCFVGSAFRYYQQFLGMSVANRVVMDLRRRMYDRVVQLPTSYFAQKGTSDAMSRLTQDTNTLTDGVSMALGKAIQEPIKAVCSFGLALWIDWRLCLLVILSMPVLGIIIRKFSKRMRRASRGTLENWSRMLAVINETLIGVRVVKAYSGEGYERRRFTGVNKALLKEQNKLAHYASLSRPTIETMAVVLSSFPMMYAAYLVLNNHVGATEFFTLMACFTAMLEPIRKLSDVNAKIQQTNAAATRVFEVIDMESEPNHRHDLPKLARHEKSIVFENITFNYPGHEETVLRNVSLTVRRGQTVAVVGGNGSGKTTLLNFLPRLYVPTTGCVRVDGVDIGTVSLRSLRKQIGLVTQDTVLFADTIYNNIAYGTRHATPEQVYDAARRSYADEFIKGLPEGYDTKVGEHGVRLSGGQKQRIAIARAILHDPSILVLDEAMSQIDSDSEMKISLALREFTRDRTTFMIAHRFQTVISCDVIVCLDKGEVVGMGTHAELLATCGAYRKLYENQFRDTGEWAEAGGTTLVRPAGTRVAAGVGAAAEANGSADGGNVTA